MRPCAASLARARSRSSVRERSATSCRGSSGPCAARGPSRRPTSTSALREIRLALLEADVHFKVVKQFLERVRARAMGQEVLKSLTPDQAVLRIVRDEMVALLGGAEPPPTRDLLAARRRSS